MANPLTRQQIYDRIRQTSREEYVLAEMQRLGFWPKADAAPTLPEQLIRKEGELHRELSALLAEERRFDNKEALLAELRKKRMEEAKKKRAETKEKREALRIEKAERWKQTQATQIGYLGEGVSGGLNGRQSDAALLQSKGLPVLHTEAELAAAMGTTLAELRFLCYHRTVSTATHYKRFGIRKKGGGLRIISAPMPRLKAAQYWVLQRVLEPLPVHGAAHGFVKGRSILTNAAEHLRKNVLVNVDLKDFFPSVGFKRVKGLFRRLGYSEAIATLLALLCTEPEVEEAVLDGKTYFVATGPRALPQGAPTSPALTNLLCYKLDCRLQGIAKSLGFSFTRYADDISFSGGADAGGKVQPLLWRLHKTIADEGFRIHPEKIKVMRKGTRQEVTGIVVNEQPGINRDTLRRFRALLHGIEKEGLEGKQWRGANGLAAIIGYAEFVAAVKPALGAKMKAQLGRILADPRVRAQAEATIALPTETKAEKPSDSKLSPPPAENERPWWKLL